MRFRHTAWGATAALLVAVELALAATALAAYDPVGSGATQLTLDPGLFSQLKKSGVKVTAVAPAKLRGRTVTFPVASGKFDPTQEAGTVMHDGSLVFKADGRSIPLRALQLKTTRGRSPLSAKVGGSQLKLGTAERILISRAGFGDKVKVEGLTFSAKLATRLTKKLRIGKVFQPGGPLGRAVTGIQPETVSLLARNRVELSLDPGFTAKLDSLFVAVNPIFPAEHPGPFTMPILGGSIAPDASLGNLETLGALEFLQLGGGQVFWTENFIDLAARTANTEVTVQPSPPYAGKLGRVGVADHLMSGAAVTSKAQARTVQVSGGVLTSQASTAATFNEVFAKPKGKEGVFVGGETLGTISFTAQGQ